MIERKWKNKIYYSQCWEDPNILLHGLEINKEDKIISITSGGCNTLALLLKDPKEIIALDLNCAQNYLLELKISAIANLSYQDLLAFLGIDDCLDRIKLYDLLKQDLSHDAQNWWSDNLDIIKIGIIHSGKLEKYFKLFRNVVLPLIHSKKIVASLFKERSFSDQNKFYKEIWNTWQWRFLFKIFFSRRFTSLFGRNQKMFTYVHLNNIAEYYFTKTSLAMSQNPVDNYYLHYIFLGNYDKDHLPLYLRKENIPIIKERLGKIKIIKSDLGTFLTENPKQYTKYNLSNVFETFSEKETNNAFRDIIKSGRPSARLVYINHLVERTFPTDVANEIGHDELVEVSLNKQNMAFFYHKIHIDYIK